MFDKFYRELAKKYNLDERIIREVCQSPFRFISRSMRSANIKPIKIMYLGKVLPKKISLEKLEELNKEYNGLNSMNSSDHDSDSAN